MAADDLSPRNELEERRAIIQARLDGRADDVAKLIEAHYAHTCHTVGRQRF